MEFQEITISLMMNPQEELNFARNYQLLDADYDWQHQNARRILQTVKISGAFILHDLYPKSFVKHWNIKTFLKWKKSDLALLQTLYVLYPTK
jgi:hypothetical protein